MTGRDGTGEIKEDGGAMGDPRPGGRSLSSAIHTALLRIINASGLLETYQSTPSTVLGQYSIRRTHLFALRHGLGSNLLTAFTGFSCSVA